jgi:hypothetical protein
MLFEPVNLGSLLSILAVACVFLMSCASDLTERVRQYQDTYNTHDNEKLMSLYADDITFEIVGVWIKQGKPAVRELAEWDKATNLRMTISDISVSGDTATFKLVEENDWWTLANIGKVCYEPCVMVFRNGLISELRATMCQESLDAYARMWPSIIAWAKKHRHETLKELLPGGEFIYGAEAAHKWLDLLREWRASPK